jgi:DNA-binding FadR family transcriptional regulator
MQVDMTVLANREGSLSPLDSQRSLSGHGQIVQSLGEDILAGRYLPGAKLPAESELLARFGVSRTALREAIKTLSAKGLLVAKTRVGTKVADQEGWNYFDPEVLSWKVRAGMDADFRRHLVQVRLAIEPAAAELAAAHRSDDDLQAMRRAVVAMGREVSSAYDFARADLALHIAVGTASRNPMMRSVASVIEAALLEAFTLSSPVRSTILHHETVAAHQSIVDCIEARDGPGAAAAMRAVIDVGFRRIEAERAPVLPKVPCI